MLGKKTLLMSIVVGLIMLFAANVAFGLSYIPDNPPSWFNNANMRRGFSFDANRNPIEDINDPFGYGFTATMTHTADPDPPPDDIYRLDCDNVHYPDLDKLVWLPYVWQESGSGGIADPSNPLLHGSSTPGSWSWTNLGTDDLGGGLYRRTYEITISPQPEDEYFVWETVGDWRLVEVGVATTCVPEPTSILLFGFGLAGLAGFALRRRRNKK